MTWHACTCFTFWDDILNQGFFTFNFKALFGIKWKLYTLLIIWLLQQILLKKVIVSGLGSEVISSGQKKKKENMLSRNLAVAKKKKQKTTTKKENFLSRNFWSSREQTQDKQLSRSYSPLECTSTLRGNSKWDREGLGREMLQLKW